MPRIDESNPAPSQKAADVGRGPDEDQRRLVPGMDDGHMGNDLSSFPSFPGS